jgi:hypothetical protein
MMRTAGLGSLLLLLAAIGATPVRAETLSSTTVFGIYYGTLTLLAPGGNVIAKTNLETATGGGVPSQFPADWFAANDASLVAQFQSDPQSGFANIPAWVFSDLVNLEDATGFGTVSTGVSVPPSLGAPYPCCDPGQLAFNAQLASDAGGPFTTISDTGFQAPPPSLAEEVYNCALLSVLCTGQPQSYEFTYLIGPEAQCLSGAAAVGTVYCDFVNFQIASRNVTEQQLATPLPSTFAMLIGGLIGLGFLASPGPKQNNPVGLPRPEYASDRIGRCLAGRAEKANGLAPTRWVLTHSW